MATTYKFRQVGNETLTARAFADGVEIHASHPLRSCIRYQWFYNDLLTGSVAEAITGATALTFDVDLNDVSNSGEYHCEIQIGNTGDCDQVTQIRRITIVECVGPQDVLFDDGAGSGQAIVEAPHYETPVFSTEGATFITAGALVPCDASSVGANVCRFVQNYSVAATVDKSQPREAQLSITVGDITCFYNIGQDRTGAQAESVPQEKGPDGPFINLTSNGPVLAGSFFGDITVTAEVGTVGGTGTETYTVAWTNAVPTANDRVATVANPNAGATIEVTAVVTDNNGLTATASINVFFTQIIPITTTVMGDTLGRVNWQVLQGIGPGGTVPGTRNVSGTFESGGAGNWTATSNWYEGFFGAASTAGSSTLTITGPGVNETLTVSPTSTSAMFEATNRTGTYEWELTITGVLPDRSYANVSALIYARQF